MWFGTLVGLSRYDGYEFKVNLFEGPQKRLWIKTGDSNLLLLHFAGFVFWQ